MPNESNTLGERFWGKVSKTDGCWEWTGGKNVYGYGRHHVTWLHGQRMAHRLAYEELAGPIPDGLTLDHLCRNRACVNPAHLEPVTLAENKRRGYSITAVNARKTHCKRGHPLEGDNLWINLKTGGRMCKKCNAMRQRATQARRRKRDLSGGDSVVSNAGTGERLPRSDAGGAVAD